MIVAAILATAIPWMLIVLDRTGGQVTGDPTGAPAVQQRSPDAAASSAPASNPEEAKPNAATPVLQPDDISSTATPDVTESPPAASNLQEPKPATDPERTSAPSTPAPSRTAGSHASAPLPRPLPLSQLGTPSLSQRAAPSSSLQEEASRPAPGARGATAPASTMPATPDVAGVAASREGTPDTPGFTEGGGSRETERGQPPTAQRAVLTTPTPPPVPAVISDAQQIRALLDRYASAYQRLDAAAVHSVWPMVDRHALARAFGTLESQQFTFDSCTIQVAGLGATASCVGWVAYVPRVGNKDPRTLQRAWAFDLQKRHDSWLITSATMK